MLANIQRLLEEIKDITGQKETAAQAFQEADATRSLFLEYAPVKKAYEDSLAQMPAMEEKQKEWKKSQSIKQK